MDTVEQSMWIVDVRPTGDNEVLAIPESVTPNPTQEKRDESIKSQAIGASDEKEQSRKTDEERALENLVLGGKKRTRPMTSKKRLVRHPVKGKKLLKRPSKNKNGARRATPKSSSELQLEKLVLGRGDAVIASLTNKQQDRSTFLRSTSVLESLSRRPAWTDSDDVSTRVTGITAAVSGSEKLYSAKLRNKFVSVVGNPSWADLDTKNKSLDSASDSDEDISRKVGDYIVKSETLVPGNLYFRQQKHVASHDSNLGIARTVRFHPTSQVALVASRKSTVGIFQIDGTANSRIQEIDFDGMPISGAEFSPDGEHFIVSSFKRKYYYCYNMMTGESVKRYWNRAMVGLSQRSFSLSPDGKMIVFPSDSGAVHFISAKTNEWLYSLQMNTEATGGTFSSDSSKYYSNTISGEVYIWDLKSRACLHKFNDEGCINGSALALSPNQQYLACGSNTGVVNLYDTSTVMKSLYPKPLKAILNLTTVVTDLKFNSTSEILVMNSNVKDSAIRIFHCRSLTTFSNFPFTQYHLSGVLSMDLSVNSGYLAVGCRTGVVPLFRLNHYGSY